mmetsp:Transcript_2124/g.8255  ORF Transcript_2124/g.8255 Transcript_2124/m.8255 type:complete len:264 (+) Transcript_2124:1877-2668(+)
MELASNRGFVDFSGASACATASARARLPAMRDAAGKRAPGAQTAASRRGPRAREATVTAARMGSSAQPAAALSIRHPVPRRCGSPARASVSRLGRPGRNGCRHCARVCRGEPSPRPLVRRLRIALRGPLAGGPRGSQGLRVHSGANLRQWPHGSRGLPRPVGSSARWRPEGRRGLQHPVHRDCGRRAVQCFRGGGPRGGARGDLRIRRDAAARKGVQRRSRCACPSLRPQHACCRACERGRAPGGAPRTGGGPRAARRADGQA